MGSFTSFEQLECWKACREVIKWVRAAVTKLPAREFDLKDNISRAARSTTRNLAEGFGRFHYQENIPFCRISRGSLFAIIDDAITLLEEKCISEEEYKEGRNKISYAIKVLNGSIKYLQKQKDPPKQNDYPNHSNTQSLNHSTTFPLSLSITSISLFQFKNYDFRLYSFTNRIVGICGRNGAGKTNLLDAIHYLCFTKSYFSRNDSFNVKHGQQGFRLEGWFRLNGKEEKAVCILRETGKKEFSLDDEPYSRFSKHIGHYPCVVIAPDDVELIIGSSEDRRKFLDTILCQLDPVYLQALIHYNKILQQRNSFLRSFNDGFARDLSVLDVLDDQLAKEGDLVFKKRAQFLKEFLPIAARLYGEISQQEEKVALLYDSELHQSGLAELLRLTRQKDLVVQRTSAGIHRDDLVFQLGAQTFKSIASQGQRKSLLFALKLAEMEILKREKGFSPLLLLDDVFEKLDEERISNLLANVCSDEETQIFITDTNCRRLQEGLQKIGQEGQLIML